MSLCKNLVGARMSGGKRNFTQNCLLEALVSADDLSRKSFGSITESRNGHHYQEKNSFNHLSNAVVAA